MLKTSTPTAVAEPSLVQIGPMVLVVEDEEKTRMSVAEGLQLEGWTVVTAAAGDEALHAMTESKFDLLVLDWMLPGLDGVALLRQLAARGAKIPVLMLTARDTVADRVTGLESGADDYLAKPFAFAELVARCRALLRRPQLETGRYLSCEDLQVDTRARVAVRAGKEILLTPREVDILEYLLQRQGEIITREMLEHDVWKQARRFTSLDNVIDVQMMRLRRKVDGDGVRRLIHTVRGVGYRIGRGSA